jgi:5-methylcytosine-specific restriction endonuclease McrA
MRMVRMEGWRRYMHRIRNGKKMICEICKTRVATQRHHRFPQHKAHIKCYGKKLIDAAFNIVPVCSECNAGHNNIPDGYRDDELMFRARAAERGYTLPPPMKSCRVK